MDLEQIGCEDVHWILPARNRDQWRVFVKALSIFRLHEGGRLS
jgi:hypothetical protein